MDLDVTTTLKELLEAHGAKTQPAGDSIQVGNMTTSAWVYRKPSNLSNLLQLDVRVNSPLLGTRLLIESFAGWGDTEHSAVNEAWGKFSTASLHVLLQVFVHQEHDDQVESESWEGDLGGWKVCMGPLFTVNFKSGPLPNLACGDLIDQLRDKLLPTLTKEVHWVRFFFMKSDASHYGGECLVDNVPWPDGKRLVEEWKWPEGFYSARLFLIMLPR